MKPLITYVQRKPSTSVSIERVFRQIARDLPQNEFDVGFQSVKHGNGIAAILKNLFSFRPRASDIYHITGDINYISLILPKRRTVLTIHDLIFLHRRAGLRRYILKKLYLDLPLRRAKYITVVSEAIKNEIISQTGIDDGRIRVFPNPLIAGFEAVERAFNAECPVILHIGTAENKNLKNLIAAVAKINCKLKIVGRLSANIVADLRDAQVAYENAFDLNESEIIEEYKNCDIVSFCSSYEGFGLPIIEAQAMQKPVLTSNIAPMRDVAGDGALLVDPADLSQITNGLRRIIDDQKLRNQLIGAGLENIKRFDGISIASGYAEFYRQILDQSRSEID